MRQQAVCRLNLGIFHGFSCPAVQLLSGIWLWQQTAASAGSDRKLSVQTASDRWKVG